jgi:hypothetical protein
MQRRHGCLDHEALHTAHAFAWVPQELIQHAAARGRMVGLHERRELKAVLRHAAAEMKLLQRLLRPNSLLFSDGLWKVRPARKRSVGADAK